jgi:exonuclease III
LSQIADRSTLFQLHPMVRVLFWNINGKPLGELLRKICDNYDVDILVLAECRIPNTDLLSELNHGAARTFTNPLNLSDRIAFYARLPEQFIASVTDADYWSIRAIDPPLGQQVLLVGVHYPSKLYAATDEQSLMMPRLADDIREAEQRYGHTRTVVVGDLNMNPFEAGVCSAEGLHAVMCKTIAKKEKRVVYGRERMYFYLKFPIS